jgi:hypothetical protein
MGVSFSLFKMDITAAIPHSSGICPIVQVSFKTFNILYNNSNGSCLCYHTLETFHS